MCFIISLPPANVFGCFNYILQDYGKTVELIFLKFGRMDHGPRKYLLYFSVNLDTGVDLGLLLFFNLFQ